MDYSPPGFSVHGILQAKILEWIVIPFSRGSSWPRAWTWVSCIAGGFFSPAEPPGKPSLELRHLVFSRQNLVLCLPLPSKAILLFNHSVVSDSLQPRQLQHTRLPCPSPSPRVCPNACPLSQWCQTIRTSFSTSYKTLSRIWFDTSLQRGQASRNIQELTPQWKKCSNESLEFTGCIMFFTTLRQQLDSFCGLLKTQLQWWRGSGQSTPRCAMLACKLLWTENRQGLKDSERTFEQHPQ